MAAHLAFRLPSRSTICLLSYFVLLFLLVASSPSAVHASPLGISSQTSATSFSSSPPPSRPRTLVKHSLVLAPRRNTIINNSTGTPQVFNPSTQQLVPQGPATDGSGAGFDAPAIAWLAFCFAVGIPMSLAGFRGRRVTTGVGIGLAGAVLSWAALVNTTSAIGVSDLLLSLIVLGFFLLGFALGLLRFAFQAGLGCLGVAGGVSVGVRIVLLRRGLLFPGDSDLTFAADWILAAALGALGGLSLVWERWERAGVLFACASTGTFLEFLAIDLIMNKQGGMSRGLRFLFDRNTSHLVDIMSSKYSPPLSTFILVGVSLGMTPILAYVQHRLFLKHSFRPPSSSNDDEEFDPYQAQGKGRWTRDKKFSVGPGDRQTRFFADLWDAARMRGGSANRFSV